MKTINLCENTDFPNKIGKGTRILGIDPGKKNIGISISDPSQKIATPLKIIFMKKFKKFIEDLNSSNNNKSLEAKLLTPLAPTD